MKRKRDQPPTVTMELVPAPDADQRLRRTFDLILGVVGRAKEQPADQPADEPRREGSEDDQ